MPFINEQNENWKLFFAHSNESDGFKRTFVQRLFRPFDSTVCDSYADEMHEFVCHLPNFRDENMNSKRSSEFFGLQPLREFLFFSSSNIFPANFVNRHINRHVSTNVYEAYSCACLFYITTTGYKYRN